jgi:hypothetical protein
MLNNEIQKEKKYKIKGKKMGKIQKKKKLKQTKNKTTTSPVHMNKT